MPRHLVALIAILLLAAGCETTPTATTSLSNATARYQAGDLDAARSIATPLVRHDGTESDEAAWIIGLCDYRQDRMTAARERFRYVTTGPNTSLAAQARVMLAQMELADGDASACLASLARAWPDLPPDHRRRTAELAVGAAQSLDDTAAVNLWLARMPSAPSRTTPEMAAARDRFTLQAGAYRNRSGAEKARSALGQQTTTLGQATIRTRTDRRGETLYLVQIGSFSTRAAADSAKQLLPRTNLVVVAR